MTEHPYAVTAGEAADAVTAAARAFFAGTAYIPLMLWGDPGVGKTEAPKAAARALDARLLVVHVADREPTEIGGLYWVVNGEVKRLAPTDLPIGGDEPTILFFDEVPQAPMMNKNVLARVVLDREVSGHRLGSKVYVCCAGNHARNRAGTTPMPSHLNARLCHMDVVVDPVAWGDWAAANNVHPFVTSYIKWQPQSLHKPNPDERATPNPRSWARVSEIEFAGLTGQARKAALVGTLGLEVGTEYIARSDLLRDMPDPDVILRDPKGAPLPPSRAVMFATVSALAARAKPNNIQAIITYTSRMEGDEEYQVLCLREARLRNPAVASARAFTDFLRSARGQALA
ncbi:AAA domain containing protein [Planktothrix phage Pra-JY27]|nr:ATPase [Planktothrix phage Pag-Yong1]WEV89258.1 MoxR family ATPase [Synechococcus phage MinM2]